MFRIRMRECKSPLSKTSLLGYWVLRSKKATSNVEIQQAFSSFHLLLPFLVCLRGGTSTTDTVTLKLAPNRGTHCLTIQSEIKFIFPDALFRLRNSQK